MKWTGDGESEAEEFYKIPFKTLANFNYWAEIWMQYASGDGSMGTSTCKKMDLQYYNILQPQLVN